MRRADDTWEPQEVLATSAPRLLSAYALERGIDISSAAGGGGAQAAMEVEVPAAAGGEPAAAAAAAPVKAESPSTTSPPQTGGAEGPPKVEKSAKAEEKPKLEKVEKPKKEQNKKSQEQLKALNDAYKASSETPAGDALTAMASSTGLPEKDIKDFFNRKRARDKQKPKGDGEGKKCKGKDGESGPAKAEQEAAAATARQELNPAYLALALEEFLRAAGVARARHLMTVHGVCSIDDLLVADLSGPDLENLDGQLRKSLLLAIEQAKGKMLGVPAGLVEPCPTCGYHHKMRAGASAVGSSVALECGLAEKLQLSECWRHLPGRLPPPPWTALIGTARPPSDESSFGWWEPRGCWQVEATPSQAIQKDSSVCPLCLTHVR